jgi:toxin secretion/phage lysis holin
MIGGFDVAIRALLILLILDFIMGFSIAFRDHKLSRKKMMAGLYKMMVYFVGVSMAHWTDILIFHTTVEFWFQNFIIVYLWVNESLSIIKHMNDFWVKVPIQLIQRLESYRDNGSIDTRKD